MAYATALRCRGAAAVAGAAVGGAGRSADPGDGSTADPAGGTEGAVDGDGGIVSGGETATADGTADTAGTTTTGGGSVGSGSTSSSGAEYVDANAGGGPAGEARPSISRRNAATSCGLSFGRSESAASMAVRKGSL